MKMKITTLKHALALLLLPSAMMSINAHSHEDDDPLLSSVMIDQLEVRNTDGPNQGVLEGQTWIGHDLHKLWLKTDFERRDSMTESAEVQALFSTAIAPFWDIQAGVRHDSKPTPTRDWGVIGVQGLAPYRFDIDTALFVGESGRSAVRLKAEYDLLFTQRLILAPNVEINLYGQNDAETGVGSGLSDAEAGLRLRYEIRREFAPYIGINWNKKFGNTADFARASGESVHDTQWVVGLRIRF
jgi:copper resistance protein B